MAKYNKYHNKKIEKYNQIWDSDMELDYYEGVCLPNLENGTWISVETQKVFILQEAFVQQGRKIQPIKYIADFFITTANGEQIVVDTKGMPATTDFKLKWKMLRFRFPQYTYRCLKGSGRDKRRGIIHYQKWEEVIDKPRATKKKKK